MTVIENYIAEAEDSEKPHVSLLEILNKRFKALSTTATTDVNQVNDLEVTEAVEVKAVEEVLPEKVEVLKAELVMPSALDIVHSIEPNRIAFRKIDLDDLMWKDTNDMIGYKEIKLSLSKPYS